MKGKQITDLKIILKKDIVYNPNISPAMLLAYIGLKKNARFDFDKQLINCRGIYFTLTDELKTFTARTNHLIIEGIKEVSDYFNSITENSIYPINKTQSEIIFTPSDIVVHINKKETYTTIDSEDVKYILNNGGQARFDILKYYVILLGTIISKSQIVVNEFDSKSFVMGNKTLKQLEAITGYAHSTIIKYNEFLENAKIIYINREIGSYIEDTVFTAVPNIYCLYENRHYVDTYVQDMYKDKFCQKRTKAANKRRGLTQKYYHLATSVNCKYSQEEIQEIYDYIIESNRKAQEIIDNLSDKTDDYSTQEVIRQKQKIKDVSVFDKYTNIQKF